MEGPKGMLTYDDVTRFRWLAFFAGGGISIPRVISRAPGDITNRSRGGGTPNVPGGSSCTVGGASGNCGPLEGAPGEIISISGR